MGCQPNVGFQCRWGNKTARTRPPGVGTMPIKNGDCHEYAKPFPTNASRWTGQRVPQVTLGLAMVLVAGLLGSGLAHSFAQSGGDKQADAKAEPKGKLFNFEMRGKPWTSVFEWLADNTDRKFVGPNISPTGTFNVITPKGQKYTIPQIIDMINDGLLSQKWVLLNRGTAYTLVPADEKIDPALIPRIEINELADHGNTEIVQTVYQCKSLNAEDTAPEVKKQMGPFGEVQPLHRANALLLQDSVANLTRIKKELDSQERNEGEGQAETFAYKCIYIRASQAEAQLRSFLGEQKQITEILKQGPSSTGGPIGPGSGGPGGQGGPGSDPYQGGRFPGDFSGGGKKGMSQGLSSSSTRIRAYTVTSDDRTNTVFVNGPPDKIAQAKTFMKNIDTGTVPIVPGPSVLQTYPIKEGNAIELSKTLNELHKGSPHIRIAPIGNNQLMVLAPPEDQILILQQINGFRPPATKTETLPLTLLEAARTVDTLQKMFPDSRNGRSLPGSRPQPQCDPHQGDR